MLNKCIRRNFFPLVAKKQRSKNKKKLRLISGYVESDSVTGENFESIDFLYNRR